MVAFEPFKIVFVLITPRWNLGLKGHSSSSGAKTTDLYGSLPSE